ncbi:MAG TPA: ATPase, T2SS/T4P/T4SS family, partial [Candidatus Ozemobacteraceae bacterium]|nr:ATPase, T2SS/T4P/T4SS family [Candidatus Ozemobacteraceae bacterium]
IASPFGLVVMAGPYGSGKTTTAYHALQQLRENGRVNLATVEAPYEMILPGVAQTHVRPHLGLTFPALLAAIERGDPDVIYVSDIPDEDTMSRVLKLALTGHLIFVTMHASSVEEVIGKLLDLKAPAHLLASALTGIMIQHLARKVCSACAHAVKLPATALKPYKLGKVTTSGREGKGCATCNQSGYRGRMPLYEIFTPDKSFKDTMQTGDRSGIRRALQIPPRRTLAVAAAEAVAAGLTTLAELDRVTNS